MKLISRVLVVFFLMVAAFSLMAQGQMLRASQYQTGSSSVADMVTKAQADCVSGMTCVIEIGPELSNFTEGSLPSRCSGCVWADYRAGFSLSGARLSEEGVPVVSVKYPGLVSFGDSITCGFLATQGYPALLAADFGGTLTNWCRNGDMAADAARQWVYAKTNPSYTRQPTFSYALGINDSTSYGTDVNRQAITKTTITAALAWLAIPSSGKVLGQATTKTGTWTNDDTIQVGLASQSTVSGSTASASVVSYGSPIFVGYRIFDGGTGSATLSIDGVQVDTLNAYGFNHALISTTNGTTDSVAIGRYPVSSGTHTVKVTTTNSGTFSLVWAGSLPKLKAFAAPRVLVGAVTREQNDANEPTNSLYDGFVRSIVGTLAGDGLRVLYVPTRDYLNTTSDLADLKHPNDTGQQHMRDAFAFIAQPASGGANAGGVFSAAVSVSVPGEADTNQYTNVNAGAVFSQTLLNPGLLVYKGNNREAGIDLGSEDWPNPSTRVFAPDNASVKLCTHPGGVALTVHTQFTCQLKVTSAGVQVGGAIFPGTAGGIDSGTASNPWSGIQIGSSTTNRTRITSLATSPHTDSMPDVGGTVAVAPAAIITNKAACWKGTGQVGYCSTQPDATGACTCN